VCLVLADVLYKIALPDSGVPASRITVGTRKLSFKGRKRVYQVAALENAILLPRFFSDVPRCGKPGDVILRTSGQCE
jgi:hypothetical protein